MHTWDCYFLPTCKTHGPIKSDNVIIHQKHTLNTSKSQASVNDQGGILLPEEIPH